mmetsp:Transcript_30680/g.79685  ORF Transcript_30680/g.79685 Transcript_30680/m.79685 type:complete len:247 (-) Transcript_30680:683-1423(-)
MAQFLHKLRRTSIMGAAICVEAPIAQWRHLRHRLTDELPLHIRLGRVRLRQQPLGNLAQGHVLEGSDPVPFDRFDGEQCVKEGRAIGALVVKAPLGVARVGVGKMLSNLLLAQPATRAVGVDKSDDGLAHTDGRAELDHAVLRLEVALGAEDEHCLRPPHIALQVGDVLEIVDVEEDGEIGHHLEQPLLDDAHLVLARSPGVREEEVVAILALQGLCSHVRVGLLLAQPPSTHRTGRLKALVNHHK